MSGYGSCKVLEESPHTIGVAEIGFEFPLLLATD